MIVLQRQYWNKTSVSSDLYTYGAFYPGDENKGTITGKHVPYVSSRILSMRILDVNCNVE